MSSHADLGSASELYSSCVPSSKLFSTPAREIKVFNAEATRKTYFVQESVLISIPYFKAQLERWAGRECFEVTLPMNSSHSSFEHILTRLLSSQKPPWDSIRWSGAVQKDLYEALGIMLLSRMLLVDWISAEISGTIHFLANSSESSQLVRDVSQRAGLSELTFSDGDGDRMPSLSLLEVKAMLCSAAKGHQAGRDFARDVIKWRHKRGHGSEDAVSLIDTLKNVGQIVDNWDWGQFPLDVFTWLWDLICQYALPNSDNFKKIVDAFAPLGGLMDMHCVNSRGQRSFTGQSRVTRELNPDSRLQIREAFKQLLYTGFRFQKFDIVSEKDLQAVFNIGVRCSSKLLSFSGIHQDMPECLPALIRDWVPAVSNSMAEWIVISMHNNLQGKLWEFLTAAMLASFNEQLQMKCVLMAPTSFFNLSKLEALRNEPCERARCRLATMAGELDPEVLEFLRGRKRRRTG